MLDDLVDRVGERGGALVVRGEAGTGKSALLAAASTRSRKRGIVVLTTVGVQSEAQCPAGATAQHAGAAGRALAGISDGRGMVGVVTAVLAGSRFGTARGGSIITTWRFRAPLRSAGRAASSPVAVV